MLPHSLVLSPHAVLYYDDELFGEQSDERSVEQIDGSVQTEIHSSKQLGIDGEQLVLKALGPGAQLVSGTGHMGDIHLITPQYQLLVEVKNKATSTAEDYDKFKRDFIGFSSTHPSPWGLYISLQEELPWKIEDKCVYVYGAQSLRVLPVLKHLMQTPTKDQVKSALFSQLNYDNELEKLFILTEKLKDYGALIQNIQLQSKIVESFRKKNEEILQECNLKRDEREALCELLKKDKTVKKATLLGLFPHLGLGRLTLAQIKDVYGPQE